jgi:hypothetical protein
MVGNLGEDDLDHQIEWPKPDIQSDSFFWCDHFTLIPDGTIGACP